MVRIIDNKTDESRLGLVLKEWIDSETSHITSIDISTGYFNLRGWRLLDEQVRGLAERRTHSQDPVARVLVGMVMPSESVTALEQLQSEMKGDESGGVDREKAKLARQVLIDHLRTQLMTGLPTQHDRAALQSLHELVTEKKVAIKVYTRAPLHGKTQIFHRADVMAPVHAIVGSSNLTYPGLMTNLELNARLTDGGQAQEVALWFQELWEDKFSLDITDHLLEILDESWASPRVRDPYDVYMKVCYELSKDVREGLEEYVLPAVLDKKLLEYQKTAVKTLARRIMAHGGTMLGDVVGLGKTLTAISVASILLGEHGYQPLVVCPKNLVGMWEQHFEMYDLHGKVVPYSMVHAELPQLRRYPFVIVDESHVLRNEKTKTYQFVQDYIARNESKCLLLTATPYNLDFEDVANQLGLFLDEDRDLGIAPTHAIAANPNLGGNLDFGFKTLAAFRRSQYPEDWRRLMGEHLVRRTRTFVKENYGVDDGSGRKKLTFADGSSFYFPERRAIPVDHEFTVDDPAALMVDDETLDALKELTLPRYDLAEYLVPGVDKIATEDEAQVIEDLKQSRGNVAGFVRTNFYKRLSSCGYSFMLSLQRHLSRNELFVYALQHNLKLPIGTIDANVLLGDSDAEDETDSFGTTLVVADRHNRAQEDYEALIERNPAGIKWMSPNLFAESLARDLIADASAIQEQLERYVGWSVENDSKLALLHELLVKEHAGEKVLIFTEYKDTADYIGRALAKLGVDRVGVATGQSENPTDLAHRFSPVSNQLLSGEDSLVTGENEISVLVATDVLAEGQNLQDAHIVVNFDLPWAIIKLIQRAGRVDRIGQQSDEVLLYTISHGNVEEVLSLRQRIHTRLHDNALAFGSDEKFFDTEEEIQIIRDLYDGKIDDHESTEEVDAYSLAFEIWRQAVESDDTLNDRIAQLPDSIDATRRLRIDERPAIAAYVKTENGIDAFAKADIGGEVALLTGHEALKWFECEPGSQGLERHDVQDEVVRELLTEALKAPTNLAGRLRGVRKRAWNRVGGNTLHMDLDVTSKEAIESLYETPLTGLAARRLQTLMRQGATDEVLVAEIKRLHGQEQLVIAGSSQDNDTVRIVSVMGAK